MPQADKTLHIVSEGAAIFILVPYLYFLLKTEIKTPLHKIIISFVIILTLLVDGYLFSKRNTW